MNRSDDCLRTCVGCKQRDKANAMTRYVLQGGELILDPRAISHGRGAWLHRSEQCRSQAMRRGGFARSFHQTVKMAREKAA